MSRAPAPHVFLVAGEESGDRLGAALIAAIKRRSPGARFSGVGGAQMAGAWRAKPVSARRSCHHRHCRHPGGPAENPQTHSAKPPTPSSPPSRMCWSSSTARNSPIAWRGACARARRNPDRRLCVSVGVGLAAGPRARDARIRRPRAGAVAVRAGGDAAVGRAAVHLRRPSAERTGRRACGLMPRRRAGAWPIRRCCWCCRAAARAKSAAWRRIR